MTDNRKVSAGILLFRRGRGGIELLLGHPGGPFWAKRDEGAWTLPKGLTERDEDLLEAARREFREETGMSLDGPFLPLGQIKQRSGKIVHAWACEGDADVSAMTSNETSAEWPRGSGRWITFPEIDRCAWFAPDSARQKLNPAQAEFVDRLAATLGD